MRRRAFLVLLLALAHGAPQPVRAEAEALLERAEALGLARRPAWQALLHVVPRRFGLRRESEIPGGSFFLAPDGRTNPAAELEATLRALLEARTDGGDSAAHCRFPARAVWLARELGVPLERLAPAPCPALDEWRKGLAPRGITLIFPEAFMNNPASMFGHTLLRLDVADPQEPRNLLSYAIDFTANTGGDAGPVYLAKGAFGLYPGYFGVNPYYQKLELYGDWQNRRHLGVSPRPQLRGGRARAPPPLGARRRRDPLLLLSPELLVPADPAARGRAPGSRLPPRFPRSA